MKRLTLAVLLAAGISTSFAAGDPKPGDILHCDQSLKKFVGIKSSRLAYAALEKLPNLKQDQYGWLACQYNAITTKDTKKIVTVWAPLSDESDYTWLKLSQKDQWKGAKEAKWEVANQPHKVVVCPKADPLDRQCNVTVF